VSRTSTTTNGGFNRGTFESHHDNFHSSNWSHCHSNGCWSSCWPWFGFSVGFGFGVGWGWGYPYYAAYYSPWYDPWYYPYPYYAAYPAYPYYGSYGYPYDGGTTVNNNYYYSGAPAGGGEASTPAPSGAAAPAESQGGISPLPKADESDGARAEVERVPGKGSIAYPNSSQALNEALSGLANFRDGRYPEASEDLYAAVQSDPASPGLKVYLAESLFAIGEYKFAGDYLRQAILTRPGVALQPFDLDRLYAPTPDGQADLNRHLGALKEHLELQPYDADALLVLGFLQLQGGDPSEAAGTLLALNDYTENPLSQQAASQLFAAVQLRNLSLADGLPGLNASPTPGEAGFVTEDELGDALSAALN
jgi:tetratricopeptide (TPR) repeat protein